ncbi:MAG TPA: A/G-specific adenine glycosylase [Longimicrobiaceae bacterium]|nr:A/G-specific adenine glycosylase [Longimicrobiaceae bacterium]
MPRTPSAPAVPAPGSPAGRRLREALPSVREGLLAWYDAHRRELPWRAGAHETPDPYRVWLSEVMLQQTRVETVRPYFQRWVERFPTLDALARAPLDDVLKHWEGLGYYSRARNFHLAVREVAAAFGGRVPDDPQAFRGLPGVGRYTAGAVMSIAFGRAEPLVDGNVRRVFARLTDDPEPSEQELWGLATAVVAGSRPGDVNQGLMELGATVCTPRNPRCAKCPVADVCQARAAGTQEQRPARKKTRPVPHEDTAVAVIHDGAGRLLLVRRPLDVRLGGLWAFPAVVRKRGETEAAAAARAASEVLDLTVHGDEVVAVVPHAFTHVRATYRAVRCSVVAGRPRELQCDGWAWVGAHEVDSYALPVAQRKIFALAAEPARLTAAG